jgi:hypothetical protein
LLDMAESAIALNSNGWRGENVSYMCIQGQLNLIFKSPRQTLIAKEFLPLAASQTAPSGSKLCFQYTKHI